MDNKEFRAYVTEQRRIGLDNGQIARKLGMSVGIFEDACKFAFEETETPVIQPKGPDKTVIDAVAQKPRKEKVPGIYYVPQSDDDEHMDPPVAKEPAPAPVKKTREKKTASKTDTSNTK